MRAFKWCALIVVLFGFGLAPTEGQPSSKEHNFSFQAQEDSTDNPPTSVTISDPNTVELFEHKYFTGKGLTITKDNTNRCYNFYKSNLSNFNDVTTSMRLNDNCINIFSVIGCSGTYSMLNSSTPRKCLENWKSCKYWNDRISSLAWCESSFPPAFEQPEGSQGYPCIDSCDHRGRNYFWCHTLNGSMDYCRKRDGLDYFGNECELNCSTLEEFNPMPIFYENEDYNGRYLELAKEENETRCYTFRYVNESYVNFDNAVSSVDVKQNCIYLHEHIGCLGKSLQLSVDKNVRCHANLAACKWKNIASSFRFCHTRFPRNHLNPNGSSGFPCLGSCEFGSMSYFRCKLKNGKWDYCSPRPNTNYLGKDCAHNCSYAEPHYHQSATLYEEPGRQGKRFRISSEGQRRCVNLLILNGVDLPQRREFRSLRLESSCIRVYASEGCSGDYAEFTSEDKSTCHDDLSRCWIRRTVAPASVRFCDAEIFSEVANPSGLRGAPCSTSCQATKWPFFWCGVNDTMDWDFCSPRPGTDAIGKDCEGNCSQNNENLLQRERLYRGKDQAVLHVESQFHGSSKVLEKITGVNCLNLGYESGYDKDINWNKMVYSVNLSTVGPITYINLYSGIGCSEDTFRLSSGDHCRNNLEWCDWKEKVSSVSFSHSALPPPFPEPRGLNGEICTNACLPRGKSYFWCYVGNGSWDFCSPRPGQNFMGNFCEGNCTEAPVHKQRASFHVARWLKEESVTIEADNETISCFNTEDVHISLEHRVRSLAIETDGCLNLFDEVGCTGPSLTISYHLNLECMRDLEICHWREKTSSASFCSTTPVSQENQVGYHGERCATPCLWRGKSYFWCYLVGGGRDYCSPKQGYDTYGRKCNGSCSHKGFDMPQPETSDDTKAAVLYVKRGLQGRNITISWDNQPLCFNLGYDDELSSNFNKFILSVDLVSSSSWACLLLHSSTGCTGESLVVSGWHNQRCLQNLGECNWEFKVSSVSGCERRLPSMSELPRGVWGETIPKPTLRASLYLTQGFGGDHITIDGTSATQCFTLGYDAELSINFNNALMSIALDNGACLHLYDRIGCLGRPLEVSLEKDPKCLWNLEACGMHRKVSSLSFCNTVFPSEYTSPIGVQGNPCSGSCYERGIPSTYFRCRTNRSWDFCSPRPAVNYFGEDLTASVFYEEAAILYDQVQFKGRKAALSNSKNKLCHNWQEGGRENFPRHPASFDLRGGCLQIYEGIGCSGNFLEIVADDVDGCHVDLRTCGWHNRVLSIRFCNAPWPEKYTQPNGSRGDLCNDDCDTRGKPYFWCHVQNDTSDYCLPRPGQDLFGNDCEADCFNLSNLGSAAISSPRNDPRNMCLPLSVLATTLWVYH